VVRKPRPGGQSIMIAEKSTGSFSIACLKIYSFPSLLLISYSAFARETLEPIINHLIKNVFSFLK